MAGSSPLLAAAARGDRAVAPHPYNRRMSIDSEAVVEFEVAADLSSVCLVYPFVDTRTGPFSERVRAVNGARWAGEPHNRHAAPVWLPQTFGDVNYRPLKQAACP